MKLKVNKMLLGLLFALSTSSVYGLDLSGNIDGNSVSMTTAYEFNDNEIVNKVEAGDVDVGDGSAVNLGVDLSGANAEDNYIENDVTLGDVDVGDGSSLNTGVKGGS